MVDNSPENNIAVNPSADWHEAADHFYNTLVFEVPPWYASLFREIRDLVRPPKLPPLQLTSKPVTVKELWGDYRYGKVARPVSLVIHALIIAVLLVPLGTKVVEVVKKEIIYTPIDISPY